MQAAPRRPRQLRLPTQLHNGALGAADMPGTGGRDLQLSAAGKPVSGPADLAAQQAPTASGQRTAQRSASSRAARLARATCPGMQPVPGGAYDSSSAGETASEAQTAPGAAAYKAAPAQSAGLTTPPGAVHGAASARLHRDGRSGTVSAGERTWKAFMDEVDELEGPATPGKQQWPNSLWQGTGAAPADEACFATSYE